MSKKIDEYNKIIIELRTTLKDVTKKRDEALREYTFWAGRQEDAERMINYYADKLDEEMEGDTK